jgi:Domain of unknown function (DUF1858)
MSAEKLLITPKTKVGELLDEYPQLEKVLMEMSPSFEKLKNPLLRKTVARVATLAQVAIVGGLRVEEIVNRLRKETGQESTSGDPTDTEYILLKPPTWFDIKTVKEVFDATPVINSGESPMTEILSRSNSLKSEEVLEIHTPFIPAPVIDKLREKNFMVFCLLENDLHKTFIKRKV